MKFQVAFPPLLVVGILLCGSFMHHGWSRGGVANAAIGSQKRRMILQARNNETALISGNKTLLSIASGLAPIEPADWGVPVPVTTAEELQAAICRVSGTSLDETPALVACLISGIPFSDRPVSIIMHQDIFLEGQSLPPIHGSVKVVGDCEGNPCRLYAVNAQCCDCQSIWVMGNTDICSACRKGLLDNTKPFTVSSGSRLWLQDLDICAGRSTSRGGIVSLQPGDGQAWNTGLGAGLTFLSATDVGFSKGLTLDRGGAIGLWRGSMAILTRPRFTENYAALSRASSLGGVSGNSHDVAVAVRSALILEDPEPGSPSILVEKTVLPNTGNSDSFENGQSFLKSTIDSPVPVGVVSTPPPSVQVPGSPGYLITSGYGNDDASETEGGKGLFGLGDVVSGAIITSVGVLAVLGLIFLVASGRLCAGAPNSGDRTPSDDGVTDELQKAKQPDIISIQVKARQDSEEEKAEEIEKEVGRQRTISKRFKEVEQPRQIEEASANDNNAVDPAHAAEHCNIHSDPFVKNRKRQHQESCSSSPLVQPIAALADLPLPNPNFGYRSHFSVDGGKSGFVVAAFKPAFMDEPDAANAHQGTSSFWGGPADHNMPKNRDDVSHQQQSKGQNTFQKNNLMRQLLLMDRAARQSANSLLGDDDDGVEIINLE